MLRSSGFQKSGTGRAGGSRKKPKCQGINAGPAGCLSSIYLHMYNFLHINEFVHQKAGEEIPTVLEVTISVPNRDIRPASSGKELLHQQQDSLMLFSAPQSHRLHGINITYQNLPTVPKREIFCLFGKLHISFNMQIN